MQWWEVQAGGPLGRKRRKEHLQDVFPHLPALLSSYSVMELFIFPDSGHQGSEYLPAGKSSGEDSWARMCVGMCAVGSCSHGRLLLWLQLCLSCGVGQKAVSSHLWAPEVISGGRLFLGKHWVGKRHAQSPEPLSNI